MLDQLNPSVILLIVAAYFLLLITISYFTGKESNNEDFFLAGRQSPWYVVAFGMVGASLSGVTFISVPGWVEGSRFSYMAMVFGYFFGYMFIAFVLMPMYYKMKLTSIYTYLEKRFGNVSYKTGASFFLLSRTIGASFRLYLVALVLQEFVMNSFGIPFPVTVLGTIFLIWIYTFRGGIKTIIWTDTLQTLAMLVAVVLTIVFIGNKMNIGLGEMVSMVSQSEYSQIFFFENFAADSRHFFKMFISGVFVAIVMTGLDQDMMQKNLSCRTLKDAQKNMVTFSIVLIFVNLLFLGMGALLYIYAASIGIGIPEKTDLLYPTIALQHLPPAAGIVFIIGLVAAAYSSADSALTALTTSFCVDILGFEKKMLKEKEEHGGYDDDLLGETSTVVSATSQSMKRTRTLVHIGFSILLFLVIMLFWFINDEAVIKQIFTVAGYTYGPLLGLYFFGFFTKQQVQDNWTWLVCLAAPILTFFLKWILATYVGYNLSFELLILNGLLTFIGLFFISYYDEDTAEVE
jgi:Na+/proline symporter